MSGLGISAAMTDAELFGPSFTGASWDLWRAVLKATFGEPLDDDEVSTFREVAGGRNPPPHAVREAVYIVGRGGGKDSVASFIATVFAVNFDPRGKLRPGEKGVVMVIAVDRKQAGVAFGFIRGYFETIPALAATVVSMTDDSIELSNSVVIEVHTNSYRSVRGRSIICAIYDEVAFWRDESSASPDTEVDGAVEPGLGRVAGSMKILISSTYRRSGLLFERWRDCYGRDDPDTLVVLGTTLQFNPTFDAKVIDKALARDPQLFGAEYLSQWRSDLSGFLDPAWIDRAATLEAGELPPMSGAAYVCFIDPSGGRRDAMTMSIAHSRDGRVIVDLVRGRRAPFDPASVVAEFAEVMRRYGMARARSDRYAAEWMVGAFAEQGIAIDPAERSKSEIYLEVEPQFAQGTIDIPADQLVLHELRNLERRTHRGGRDSVDHPVNGTDDYANALCGAAWIVASEALPAPWHRDSLLIDGAAVEVPRYAGIFATISASRRGEAGIIYWARSRIVDHPLVIIDCALVPLGPALFSMAAARLADLATATRAHIVVMFAPAPLADEARRLGHRAEAIPDDLAADPEALALFAASAISAGRVKIAAPMLGNKPFPIGGILDAAARDDDPLRACALLGIAIVLRAA